MYFPTNFINQQLVLRFFIQYFILILLCYSNEYLIALTALKKLQLKKLFKALQAITFVPCKKDYSNVLTISIIFTTILKKYYDVYTVFNSILCAYLTCIIARM